MSSFKINQNKLITENFEVEFDYEVNKVEYIDKIYLVLLEIPKGSNEVYNLYAVKR